MGIEPWPPQPLIELPTSNPVENYILSMFLLQKLFRFEHYAVCVGNKKNSERVLSILSVLINLYCILFLTGEIFSLDHRSSRNKNT